MAWVKGVGAVILHSSDPAALAQWYAGSLGIEFHRDAADWCFYGRVGAQLKVARLCAPVSCKR